MSQTYDEWKSTEPDDDDADQRELDRRELEADMRQHPEQYRHAGCVDGTPMFPANRTFESDGD